ncbi:MAG: SGNH/GDSL hydrolase family protein [Burkholderiales bacterium]|nr:SGNH/GDSL hydrolase family protein [Burkholderiales bacterium]
MRKLTYAVAWVIGAISFSFSVQAGPFDGLYVFGDSLLDSGNSYILTGGTYPLSGPYAQAFSNGPVASQVLAQRLGLPLVASESGGNNFATSGATSHGENAAGSAYGYGLGIDSIKPLAGRGLSHQVDTFVSRGLAPSSLASSLFVLWAGSNDALSLAFQFQIDPPDDPSLLSSLFFAAGVAAAQNAQNEILTLAQAGARTMLVGNLPNFAHLPFTPPAYAPLLELFLAAFSSEFLDAEFYAALAGANPATRIKLFDANHLIEQAVGGAFGFTNVTDACLPTAGPFPIGAPCDDPDSYLFWDDIHPTARAHRILGNAMFATVVPEPGSLLLVAVSFAGIMLARSRRHERRVV